MSKVICIICTVFVFTACSSVQETSKQDGAAGKDVQEQTVENQLKPVHDNLKNLTAKGQITFKQKDSKITGTYKASIAGTDSLSLSLFGPLQIAAGKLYAKKDYFLFFDTFNNAAFEGVPNAANLKEAFKIELAFEDMIRLFRSETPGDASRYVFAEKHEKGFLYKYIKKNEFVDFVLVDENGSVLQYQRKLPDGSAVMNAVYSDYETVQGYKLPNSIVFTFPDYDAVITFVIDGYSINDEYTQPFVFSVPTDIKRRKF